MVNFTTPHLISLGEMKFKKEFPQKLKESNYESSKKTVADEYLSQQFESYGRRECIKWIFELYQIQSIDEYFLTQLLGALSRIPYKKDEMRECITIVLESLKWEPCDIVEQAVKAIERWGYIEAIPYLEKLDRDEVYLDNYIAQVLNDLTNIKEGPFRE
jgi:hypothetical protein